MPQAPAFERLLKRDRAITVAGLLVLCALAWLYILTGAGLGKSAWEMTSLSLFPYRAAMASGGAMTAMGMVAAPTMWGLDVWLLTIAMWWVMMIAMMAPSAAPAILLYARVHRHAQGQTQDGVAPTGAFAAGYLLAWLGFSLAAAASYWALEQGGLVSAMMMGSSSRWLSGGVLIAAGAYQFSPLKGLCLAQCRAPASFLTRHWRPGAAGAVRLGMLHGVHCVGCCWMLMALLFVGGVMNLAWIALLALLVLAERAAPAGQWIGRACGGVLIAWGLATFLV